MSGSHGWEGIHCVYEANNATISPSKPKAADVISTVHTPATSPYTMMPIFWGVLTGRVSNIRQYWCRSSPASSISVQKIHFRNPLCSPFTPSGKGFLKAAVKEKRRGKPRLYSNGRSVESYAAISGFGAAVVQPVGFSAWLIA